MDGMDRVSGNHCNIVLIFIRVGPKIMDQGNVEEIRIGQQTIQSPCHAPRHAAKVEVPCHFSTHTSPGSSEVNHCHLHLPFGMASGLHSNRVDPNPIVGLSQEEVFVYVGLSGMQGSVDEVRLTPCALDVNPTMRSPGMPGF